MTAEQLEERLSFLGAQLQSGMGSGRGMFGMGGVPVSGTESYVTLNLLAKDIDEGLGLLTDCLKGCAFQADRLDLRREQELQDMKRRNDESAGIESYEWGYLMRGEDHWSNRYPTEASMNSITREDMVSFQRRTMGPKNFVLSVSGDFDKKAMVKKLEKAFAGWPTPGENPGAPAAPAEPSKAGWFIADKDVNQTRVSIGLVAVDRYDPDFPAAMVMNYVLGGGGFTSRLVNRIRSDEGLAYSVNSRLEGGFYYPGPVAAGLPDQGPFDRLRDPDRARGDQPHPRRVDLRRRSRHGQELVHRGLPRPIPECGGDLRRAGGGGVDGALPEGSQLLRRVHEPAERGHRGGRAAGGAPAAGS